MSDGAGAAGATGMSGAIIVVGAGQAGVTAAEALRAGGFTGTITMLGDEAHGPYHRPPLSKAWLAGEVDAAQLTMRSAEVLAKKGIELRVGVAVHAIDRAAGTVTLRDGQTLPYTGLVLATGARARTLSLPGADARHVHPLRTRDDAAAIADRLTHCIDGPRRVVVIGGGFIGLEVAATARKKGLPVTVLEAAARLLGRVLPPILSDAYAALHRARGVDIELDARPEDIEVEAGEAVAVRLADGRRIDCGLVVIGVGIVADDRLAREAGLECERGIVVDACGRTADPRVVAAGDCTARRLPDGTLLRLESVQGATEGGRAAAAALLGQERPFVATPWFWSDQYDIKLQMAGRPGTADRHVVRGDLAAPPCSVWHFAAERLVGVDTLNASKEHLLARKLLDAGVSPTPAQAADAGFDLATLVPARAGG